MKEKKKIYSSRYFYNTEFEHIKEGLMQKPKEYVFFEIYKDKTNHLFTRANYKCMVCKHSEKKVINSEKEIKGNEITFTTFCKNVKQCFNLAHLQRKSY